MVESAVENAKLSALLERTKKVMSSKWFSEASERSRIGVIFDEDGVILSLRLPKSNSLDAIKYIAYSTTPPVTETDKVQFLLENLSSFYPRYAQAEFWLGVSDGELCLIDLPSVRGDELDSVALLRTSQEVKFDPQDCLLDYRLLDTQGQALSLILPKLPCQKWQRAFSQARLALVGITSRKLAAASVFAKGWDSSPWVNYAVCHMSDNISVLTLIDHGEPVLIRTFNFGFNRLLGDVADRLKNGALTTTSSLETWQKGVIDHIKELFRNEQINSEEEKLAISLSLKAHAQRAVKYIERTFNYYERIEHRLMPEGVILVTDDSVSEALSIEIEEQLGLSCLSKRANVRLSEGVINDIENIRDRFKSSSMFEAVSLAFAEDSIPNVLELPPERRTKKKLAKVERWIRQLTLGGCALALGFCVYFASAWWQAQQRVNLLELQWEKIQKPLSVRVLEEKLNTLQRYEGQVKTFAQRQRFAALLAQLDDVRPDRLFVSSVDFKQTAPKWNAKNSSSQKSVVTQELVLTVRLIGNAQEREVALAHFINRLEKLMQGPVTVVPVKEEAGATYEIRWVRRLS